MRARHGGAFGTSVLLHAALPAWLLWSTYVPAQRAPGSGRKIEVVLLPPAEDSAFPGLKPVERSRAEGAPGEFAEEGSLAGADVDRIANHHLVLFPFVTPGLALDAFFPSLPSAARLVFENPYTRPPAAAVREGGRRLDLNPAALQALVDKSWTRSNRWKAFDTIRQITEAGDADDPRLAALVARYRDQNALQPYADGRVRDLRLWAQLGIAADHVDFIAFVRRFASSHPSAKVTTELLFLLDTIAEANADALAVFVETNQPGDLDWTREEHPRAYLLLRQIQRYYADPLVSRHLVSRAEIEAYYGRGRLAILDGILRTTPQRYRANDARFLIGELQWKLGTRTEAIQTWRALSAPDPTDAYAIAIDQIRAAVQSSQPDTRNIGFILKNQEGRWRSAADDRLRRFGFRADEY